LGTNDNTLNGIVAAVTVPVICFTILKLNWRACDVLPVLNIQIVVVIFGNWLYRPEASSLESASFYTVCKSVDRFRECRPV
jgi:hypothetical protein